MNKTKNNFSNFVILLLLGTGILLFWIFESAIHTFYFEKDNFINQLFSPVAHELWMRMIVIAILFGFGLAVHYLVRRLKLANDDLLRNQQDLARIVEDRTDELRKTNELLRTEVSEHKSVSVNLDERIRLAELSSEVGLVFTRENSLRVSLQQCSEAIVRYLDASFARIWTFNDEDLMLELQASAGKYTHIDGDHSRVPLGKYKIGLIAAERLPLLTNDVINDSRIHDREWAKREGMVSFAGYPLLLSDTLVGVIAAFSNRTLSETTLKTLASAADVISIGIKRKKTEQALDKYKNHLEAIVSERTSELNTANELLREERNRADKYLDIVNVMLVALDSEKQVMLVNEKGCEILGYEEHEIIGKNWFDNFIPSRLSKESVSVFDCLMNGDIESVAYYENPIMAKGGEERLIAWHNTVLTDESGNIIGTLSSGDDITDRRKMEKYLIDIEDRERRSIGHDLHDGLGQLLTGLAFKMRGLGIELEKGSVAQAEEAADMLLLVDEAKEQVSYLAKGLAPVAMDSEGLMNALIALSQYTIRMLAIPCVFKYEDTVLVHSEIASMQLYRIAQEAVTNAAKHAKPDNIEISLGMNGGKTIITIKDDGIGIPETIEKKGSMGLKIMKYRAGIINASLSIQRDINGGTMVTCILPEEPLDK